MDATTLKSRFAEFNLDPALAEAVEFASGQQVIEGILRLDDPRQIPPKFTLVSQFIRICTGRFLASDAWKIRLHPNVLSLKAARPMGIYECCKHPPRAVDSDEIVLRTNRPLPFTGRGGIVAALDFGLDFTHPNFLNSDGTTRVTAFWNQVAAYDPAQPNRYGYGRVFSRDEINRALSASDPYQALGYHPAISDTGHGSHGTHTLDIAAGNGRARGSAPGVAPDADLLFVHLSTPNPGPIGDLGDSVRMLEGLDFVHRTAQDRPWVVNLSVGRTAGSHDGTSPFEQGMHEILRLGSGRAIVQSAGNYRAADLAVEGWLRDGESRDLEWIIDPRDTTPNEIDAWYSGNDRFMVALQPPEGGRFVEVRLGEVADISHNGGLVGRIYHRKNDPNNRDNHIEVFLYPNAPSGVWTLRLIGEYVINGRFHAWIERSLARPGAQSRFDRKITTQSYTLGTIATSPLVITVGAYDAHSDGEPLAPFSSCGPTRDDRHEKPELLAPGVSVLAARSIPRGAARQEGLLVARSGTSMATPHVAGCVATMFEAAGRPVSIQQIRDCLKHAAEPVTDGENTNCCGWGRLNIADAIDRVRDLTWPDSLPASKLGNYDSGRSPTAAWPAVSDAITEEIAISSDDQRVRAPSDTIQTLFDPDRVLVRAEQAIRNSSSERLQSEIDFLQHLLRELDSRIFAPGLSPAALYRAVVKDSSTALGAEDFFTIVALPSAQAGAPLRPGDWMLRAMRGTGDVGHVSVLASDDLLPHSALAYSGIAAEGQQPGYYGVVVEGGAFPHTRTRPFARRFLDSRGRVPLHTLILHPKYSLEDGIVAPPPAEPDVRLPPPQSAWTESNPTDDYTPQRLEACKRDWIKFLDTFPPDVRESLNNQGPDSAVVVAIHLGIRDLNKLTELSFHAKYGQQRGYCPVEPRDTFYKIAWSSERMSVKNFLARPAPPRVQRGGVTCQKVERVWASPLPDSPALNITGRYEHSYPDPADPKWPITNFTFNFNQAGRHIEGHTTDVLRPQDPANDRYSTRLHGDLQADGSFLVYSITIPDQFWGYLTYEQKGQTGHLYWQQMASDENKPDGPRLRLAKVSDTPTLMESAFSDHAFLKDGPVFFHERWPLTQAQIKHLVTSLAEDKIAPLLQTYFTMPADDRVPENIKLRVAAQPLNDYLQSVFTHRYLGIHVWDLDFGRYYANNILSQGKWTFKQITRSLLDWIQIMLDVQSGFGFQLKHVTDYLALKPTVTQGQQPVDPTVKPHKYKVSFSLHGFVAYYRGTIIIEKTTGSRWKQSFKIALKGFQVKPGFSISEEGEAETYYDWTERDIPGSVELVTANIGGSIPGIKAGAGAWFMHIFGSSYLPYMTVLGTDLSAKLKLDDKFKLDVINLGGLWGEIYSKDLPDKDYSKFVPTTDYIAEYKLQDDVHFCLGSSLLTEDARQALRIVCARELRGFLSPDSTLKIVGHTDRVDTEVRNYELSEMRAKNTLVAIRDVLGSSFQIPDDPAHITQEGKGEEEAAKAQPNGEKPDPRFRRVDIFLNSRLVFSLKAK